MATMKRLLCCCFGGGTVADLKRINRPGAAVISAASKKQELNDGDLKDHNEKSGSMKTVLDFDPESTREPDVVSSHKAEEAGENDECLSLPEVENDEHPEIETDVTSIDNTVMPVEEEIVQSKAVKEVHASLHDIKPSEEVEIIVAEPPRQPSRVVATAGLTLHFEREKPHDSLTVTSPEGGVSPSNKKGKSGRSLFQLRHSAKSPVATSAETQSTDKVLLLQSTKSDASPQSAPSSSSPDE